MRVLITGGTGTLGQAICRELIGLDNVSEIVLFERSELGYTQFQNTIDSDKVSAIIGDVRNYESLALASRNTDLLIHTAAMKHIDLAEKNPLEATSINVMGTYNVIQAAKINNIPQTFFISTDKASSPTGVYGASKLMGERMMLASSTKLNKMSVFRFGNLIGSSGSIFEKWPEQIKQGKKISVTNKDMTRFFIEPSDAATYIISKINNSSGGEIFIPKMTSKKIFDIAFSFAKNLDNIEIVGLRKQEKIHENITSSYEIGTMIENRFEYVITHGDSFLKDITSN